MTRIVPSREGAHVCAESAAESSMRSPASGLAWDDRAVREGSQGFPRTARLLKADEFATLFRMRPLKRSEHFVVYARPRAVPAAPSALSGSAAGELPGRMGLVLGKKFAARAATRNMMRRALRETFRLRRAQFAGWDVLIRLNLRFDKKTFPGAASPGLKRVCRAEIIALLDEAVRQIARARKAGTSPALRAPVPPKSAS